MTQPVIGCPVSEQLAERALKLIERLRTDPASVPRDQVVDLVGDLTQASFQYHFVRPLESLGIGFATRKGIEMSLAGVTKVIRSTMHKVVKALDAGHYGQLADLLEDAYFPQAGK